jgi:hypothetical protein
VTCVRDGNNKSIQFSPGQNVERTSPRPVDSQDLPVMPRRAGRKNTVDPIGYIVFFYIVLNLVLFSIFGWLYHSLDRKIVQLSEQLAAYEQRIAQSKAYPPLLEPESAGSPATAGQTGANEQDYLYNSSNGATSKSTAYTVVPGDTWWDICQRFYEDGTYYHRLIDYNKMKKEDLIRGLVIQIPPKEELNGI